MTVTTFTRLLLLTAMILISSFSCNKEDNAPPSIEESFWPIATPEEKGLDANLVREAGRRAAELDNSYALLIIRDGALVHEQYMRGRDQHSLLHLRSITKSVVGLLAGIAIEEGHMPLEGYAFSRLAEPLGVEQFEWDRDINDKVRGGTGLQLRPRDLAKVGLLFRQEGQWEGRQIVPRQWVRDIRENSLLLSQFYPNLTDLSYRNLWWSDKVGEHWAYYGLGFGGQMLMSIPALELIIVSHHEPFVGFPQAEEQQTDFLQEVFPLIIEAAE